MRPSLRLPPRRSPVLVLAAFVLFSCGGGGKGGGSKLNFAAALGWRGYVKTDLEFGEFFDKDHTIAAWFMPQYPAGYAGPIVSNQGGSGVFMLGQGNWRGGPAPNGPKLEVVVGDAVSYYSTPTLAEGTWHHVALVRAGGVFTLYLDGAPLCQDLGPGGLFCDTFVGAGTPSPSSTVRIGMPGDGVLLNGRDAQCYGLVDDVAFFDRALLPETVQVLASTARLAGDEPGLIAGYTFDSATPTGDPLPPSLSRPAVFASQAAPGIVPSFKVLVTQARDDAIDALFLLAPLQAVARKLPFTPGERWRVIQGNSGVASHNDYACFCWDFSLAPTSRGENTGLEGVPYSSCGHPVLASASGEIDATLDGGGTCDCNSDGDGTDDCKDGRNFVRLMEHATQFGTYLHLKTTSVKDALDDMGYLLDPFTVAAGLRVGDVGTRCADNCHLHTAVSNGTDTGVTYPTAFSNYEVSTDEGATWTLVSKGVPQAGEWVRVP